MSFKPHPEKNEEEKNWYLIRIRYPGSGSADPDPHQNETDPKHWNS